LLVVLVVLFPAAPIGSVRLVPDMRSSAASPSKATPGRLPAARLRATAIGDASNLEILSSMDARNLARCQSPWWFLNEHHRTALVLAGRSIECDDAAEFRDGAQNVRGTKDSG
jgi:hypothetical protein